MQYQAFLSRYDRQFEGMARAMLRRWTTPIAVGVEDVVQELRAGAWEALQRFDSSRGDMTADSFAVCFARHRAQRWVMEQRNANRRSCKAPARFPVSATVADVDLARLAGAGDETVEYAEVFARSLQRAGENRIAVEALIESGFDVGMATRRLAGHKKARTMVRAAIECLKEQAQ